jgi:tetraprenyl-beta-curcumene synthase
LVQKELTKWKTEASRVPDQELRKQALSSIEKKKFHCMGGSVLAIGTKELAPLTRAIVAIQTISDYLDNLCDRVEFHHDYKVDYKTQKDMFMHLHESFLCAVDPNRETIDYYCRYVVTDSRGDGGYLADLVQTSRSVIEGLVSYPVVSKHVNDLALFYSKMQAIKHLHPSVRAELMEEWFGKESFRDSFQYGDLDWWEFAAASGSTLGIFALLALACNPNVKREDADAIFNLYFPDVSAFHILLDYLIDLEEDRQFQELNFVAEYPSLNEAVARMLGFFEKSMEKVELLEYPYVHKAVLRGLIAMYLSDPKAEQFLRYDVISRFTTKAGFSSRFLRWCCKVFRIFQHF